MSNIKKTVLDRHNSIYTLIDPPLGIGGQGSVYKTEEYPKTLVKIFKNHNDNRGLENIEKLLRNPLDDINIATPIIKVQSDSYTPKKLIGYTMELMDDMIPLSDLLYSKVDKDSEEAGKLEFLWFYETGGIKRRLVLLQKIAEILHYLHCSGLVYGDLSPGNIFISEDPLYNEVQFIDCDNITSILNDSRKNTYTPQYGAAEIVNGDRLYDSFSDCWSFSILAFQLLTLQHPFEGFLADELDPDEVLLKFKENLLPWILDSTNDENSSDSGFHNFFSVFSPRMKNLFKRTFENGRNSVTDRPIISEWIAAIENCLRHIKVCSDTTCKTLFLIDQVCPTCDAKPMPYIYILESYWQSDEEQTEVNAINIGNYSVLTKHRLNKGKIKDFTFEIATISLVFDATLKIVPKDSKKLTLQQLDIDDKNNINGMQSYTGEFEVNKKGKYALHIGDTNKRHPVLIFRWSGAHE